MRSSTASCLLSFISSKGDEYNPTPCLVSDTGNEVPEVKRWRSLYNLIENTVIRLSVSGAPNELGWEQIEEEIKKISTTKKKVVLDLRQEAHGYLNGYGIALASRDNWVNLGKNVEEVLVVEKNWLASLRDQSQIDLLSIAQFKRNSSEAGKLVSTDNIKDEKEVVTKLGFEYRRLAVSDHMSPSNEDVDAFVSLVDELKKEDAWLHIHCRGGHGRSSIFSAMYVMCVMLQEGVKISCEEILDKIASVNPYYKFYPKLNSTSGYVEFHTEKCAFLRKFYDYAQARVNGCSKNWSSWIADNELDNVEIENRTEYTYARKSC